MRSRKIQENDESLSKIHGFRRNLFQNPFKIDSNICFRLASPDGVYGQAVSYMQSMQRSSSLSLLNERRASDADGTQHQIQPHVLTDENEIELQAIATIHRTIDEETTPYEIPEGTPEVRCPCDATAKLVETIYQAPGDSESKKKIFSNETFRVFSEMREKINQILHFVLGHRSF